MFPAGEQPLPINQALNRPRAKPGLDLTAWMAIAFACVTVFLVGFRLLALMAFPALASKYPPAAPGALLCEPLEAA